MPEPNDKKKMKRCPKCGKDMEVAGICGNCEFDDGAAEDAAWRRAYVNRRARQIEQDMDEAEKKSRKRGGLFSSSSEDDD